MPNGGGEDLYVPYMIAGKDTSTKQNCGLLTKIDPISSQLYRSEERINYPIEGNTCNDDQSNIKDYGCTKHFYTDFHIDGISNDIRMIGVHFLAHPQDTTNCLKREAQATVISNIIKDGIKNDNFILVTGDFNDYDNQVLDAGNNIPISRVTKIIRETGLGDDLVNIVGNIDEQSERYSCWWDRDENGIDEGADGSKGNEHSLIDQFFVSKELAKYVTNVSIDHSYVNCKNTKYSDHWPIIVDFDLSNICHSSNEIKTQAKIAAGHQAIIDNAASLSNKVLFVICLLLFLFCFVVLLSFYI